MPTAPEGAVGIASWRRGWDGFGPSMGLTLRCAQGSLRLSKSAFHADLSNLGLSSRPPSARHANGAEGRRGRACLAERVGFEPTVVSLPRRFSRPLP